jgi:hypothetical protein
MNEFTLWVTRNWPEGVCHFCDVEDAQVDGDHVRWLSTKRNVCNHPGCQRKLQVEVDREQKRQRASRRSGKRTPAEVHQQIMQERRARRAASRARRKAKAA